MNGNEPETSRDRILAAALGVFSAYGFRRASMADIAEAAGLSRPALYQYFGNKAEVFRAASAAMQERALDAMAAAKGETLAERLGEMLIAWKGPAWRALAGSPHGRELADLNSALAEEVTREATGRAVALLRAAMEEGGAPGADAAEAARLLSAAAWGALERAGTEEEFRADMRALGRIFAAGVRGVDPAPADRV